tara:strand:+ start:549 stop:1829 length:1281 start_codon:yes stop_codon:yes gene_type:complete
MIKYKNLFFTFILFFSSSDVLANSDSGDSSWILASSALVLLMTLPGLALFYAGMVQSKNVVSVLSQHFALACLMSIVWIVAGYSLSFSGEGLLLGDLNNFFLANVNIDSLVGTIPEFLFIMFQMTFAIITPALIIGCYVERIKFSVVLIFSTMWLLLVYAPTAHWVWGGGFLANLGVKDFAGGIVVHTTCGLAALVVALVLGKRFSFAQGTLSPPNSPILTMIGASFLWVGWFGFNGGSALAGDSSASLAILVTHIAASIGAFTWILIEWIRFGKPSLIGMVTGMVAGLATVTPASGFIGVPGGLILGILGGLITYYFVDLIRNRLKIDDSLDVFAVHGVGGILGTLLCSILMHPNLGGVGYDEGQNASSQFIIQFQSVVIVVIWTVVATYGILKFISYFTPLRVSLEEEREGLDLSSHGEQGNQL